MNIDAIDIETDSLDATKIYYAISFDRNMESGDNYAFVGDDCYDKFPKSSIEKHAEKIVMHNGVGFDTVLNRLAKLISHSPKLRTH